MIPCRRLFALVCGGLFPVLGYGQATLTALAVRTVAGGTGVGVDALAANFQVEGATAQTVLIRAVGPTLARFGITGTLPDPVLRVYNASGTLVAENDNWGGATALSTAFTSLGMITFAVDSKDAALLFAANPGVYTAVISDAGAARGVTLIEVYEYENPTSASRLPYLTARGQVGTGANVAIAGFVVRGSTGSTASVLVRALGPALAAAGVAGALGDPNLTMFQGQNAIATNDNWTGTTVGPAGMIAGLMPLAPDSRDSALLLTLGLGSYSAQLSPGTGEPGIGIIELAQVDSARAASFVPALLVPPYPVSVTAGQSLTLPAVAIGRPAPTYQWRKDAVNIPGATNAALTLTNLQATDAGNYSVVLANSAGTTVSAAYVVTVAAAEVAPSISRQPAAQTVAAGGTATFSVVATGTPPLSYQWFRDTTLLEGATSDTLVLANVQPANQGGYRVRVTNSKGTVTSATATLTIATPPVIATQPVSLSVIAGAAASFTVSATGTAPLTYQWRKDGANLAGATNAALALASAHAADAGEYTCVVTNVAGSVTSTAATLTVRRNIAGTYFGTFDGGRGHWALLVKSDGVGTFVAFVNNPRGGIVITLKVAADGSFRVPTRLIQARAGTSTSRERPPMAAADLEVTVAGSISASNTVSGSLEGLNVGLSGVKETDDGATVAIAGLYEANAPDGTKTIAVVGKTNQMVALTIGATSVDGGLGSAANTGSFSVTTANNTNIAGTITATTGAINGTVTPSSGPAVPVSGTATSGLGPPVILTPPSAQTVAANARITFSVEVGGKTPFSYQWRKDGVILPGATQESLTLVSAQTADAGSYTCVVSNADGSITSAAAQLNVTATPASRLINLSILTDLSSAGDSFTLGFVVLGDQTAPPKPLLIRAAGPSLTAVGYANPTVADPRFETFAGATLTGGNDDWGGAAAIATAMRGVGAFEYVRPDSKDAAMVANVATPENSVSVSATGAGMVIAEVYDAAPAQPGRRLGNLSVRKYIASDLTAGFVIAGPGRKTLLIRAVGPTLRTAFNIEDAMADPQLTLFAGATPIQQNNDWGGGTALNSAFGSAGAFVLPADSRDAALVVTLDPGLYSAVASGVNNTSGTCIVEIYDLDR